MLFSAATPLTVGSSLIKNQASLIEGVRFKFKGDFQEVRASSYQVLGAWLTSDRAYARCLEVSPDGLSSEDKEIIKNHYFGTAEATLKAAQCALESGCGINIGGGLHHATLNPEEANNGCMFNDIVYAIKYLHDNEPDFKAYVLDVDFHVGGGTISALQHLGIFDDQLLWDLSGPKPHSHLSDTWKINSYTQKRSRDLFLYVNDDFKYHWKLIKAYMDSHPPDILFYNAGADVTDARFQSAKHVISPLEVASRDRTVIRFCRDKGIPICITLGGGYTPDALNCWTYLIDFCLSRYRQR